jgi:hypothetical protein
MVIVGLLGVLISELGAVRLIIMVDTNATNTHDVMHSMLSYYGLLVQLSCIN